MRSIKLAVACCAIGCSWQALADGSAWLVVPQTGYLSLSYVTQTADDYYRQTCPAPRRAGSDRCALPADLIQNTVWLSGAYGISHSMALDARFGRATSELGSGGESGLVDANVGLTWRLVDETTSDYPSVAVRAGLIVAGEYDTGQITAIGDGGDGFELSAIVGKFVSGRLSLSAEVGFRDRGDGIPANLFTNLSGALFASNSVVLGLDYRRVDTGDGYDIGGPGFTPDKFPMAREESELVTASAFVNLSDRLSGSVVYGKVVNGRNTANSDVLGVTLSYSFDRY